MESRFAHLRLSSPSAALPIDTQRPYPPTLNPFISPPREEPAPSFFNASFPPPPPISALSQQTPRLCREPRCLSCLNSSRGFLPTQQRLPPITPEWMVRYVKKPQGCNVILGLFPDASPGIVSEIFLLVRNHLVELAVDPVAHSFVEKLVEVCNDELKRQVVLLLIQNSPEFVAVCCDFYGAQVVQKLIQIIMRPQQIWPMVSAILRATIVLIKDKNGHHVIEQCMENFSSCYTQQILEKITDRCVDIATNRIGCYVLHRCFKNAEGGLNERLISEVIANAVLLSKDSFGNYAIQCLVHLRVPDITFNVLNQFQGMFAALSMHKFSSNVVETCLKESGVEGSREIIKELIDCPNVLELLHDPYANYVIQCALNVSEGSIHHSDLINLIRNNPSLHSHPIWRRYMTKR